MAKRKGKIRIRNTLYQTSQLRTAAVLLVPSLAFLIFTFIMPMFQVVQLSLTDFNMQTGIMNSVGLENFSYLLQNDRFWLSMWNTCKYAGFKLVVDTALALAIALLLDRSVPVKGFLRSTYFAPVVVPVVASSLIWIWFYDPSIGPFNQILNWLGLPTSQWLYGENSAMISILIFSLWKGVGYNMVLFLSGLQNIPDSYVEAARIDGATEWEVFRKIKWPLLKPITSFIIMIGIINSFKVFAEINVMMPAKGPTSSTLLAVVYIYEQAFTRGRFGRASAAALLLFLVIFALTMVQRRLGGKKTVDID